MCCTIVADKRLCTQKDTIRFQWSLGKLLSGKQHPNLQDLGQIWLLGTLGDGRVVTGSRQSVVTGLDTIPDPVDNESGPCSDLKVTALVFYLFILVVGVDVLERDGGEVGRELGGQSNGKRHPALQLRVGAGAVLLLIVVVASLKIFKSRIVI